MDKDNSQLSQLKQDLMHLKQKLVQQCNQNEHKVFNGKIWEIVPNLFTNEEWFQQYYPDTWKKINPWQRLFICILANKSDHFYNRGNQFSMRVIDLLKRDKEEIQEILKGNNWKEIYYYGGPIYGGYGGFGGGYGLGQGDGGFDYRNYACEGRLPDGALIMGNYVQTQEEFYAGYQHQCLQYDLLYEKDLKYFNESLQFK